MRMDNLTTKSQEAIRAALEKATRRHHPELVPEHLLVAILEQKDGIGAPLVERAGVDPRPLRRSPKGRTSFPRSMAVRSRA